MKNGEMAQITKLRLDSQQAIAHNIKDYTSKFENLIFENDSKAKEYVFRTMESVKFRAEEGKLLLDISLQQDFLDSFSEEEKKELQIVDQIPIITGFLNSMGMGVDVVDTEKYEKEHDINDEDFEERQAILTAIGMTLASWGFVAKPYENDKYISIELVANEILFKDSQPNKFANMIEIADRTEIIPNINDEGKTVGVKLKFIEYK